MSTQLELLLEGPGRVQGRRVVASISGGKDSAAMSLYLTELGIDHDRVFMDTGWEHPATYEYLRGPLQQKLGPFTEIKADVDFFGLVMKKGLFPSRVMRFCTTELKVFPMQRYLAERMAASATDIINAVGIRRAESRARSRMPEWEWSDGFDCETWRPLVRWKADDVVAIHARHGLAMNPLYGMGASRVGWPCIHARKSELALVAATDPARIDLIEQMETDLNAAGQVRDAAMGRAPLPRSMFWYHGGDSHHVPMQIRSAIDWARSKRGEWQPAGAGEGCMRHGMCEVEETAEVTS